MDDHTSERIKHLELIQGVVSRMSTNSATMKRYAIVLAAGAITFARYQQSVAVLCVGIGLILVLASLDACYLQLERRFRALYDTVRVEPPELRADFRLNPPQNGQTLAEVTLSWSVLGLYGALVVFILALMFVLGE